VKAAPWAVVIFAFGILVGVVTWCLAAQYESYIDP